MFLTTTIILAIKLVTCLATYSIQIDVGRCVGFALMSGTEIQFNGAQSIVSIGDVGVSPGVSIKGSYLTEAGTTQTNTSPAINCAADELIAYNIAKGTTCTNTTTPTDLSGLTLTSGVYCNSAGYFEINSGSLTLDAQGDSNSVFLFQTTSSVVTFTSTSIILSGSAVAENVFWQVGTALTIGSSSLFIGTILTGTGITIGSDSTLLGRALAQTFVTCANGNTVTNVYDQVTNLIFTFQPTNQPTISPTFLSTQLLGSGLTTEPTVGPTLSSTISPITRYPSVATKHPISNPTFNPTAMQCIIESLDGPVTSLELSSTLLYIQSIVPILPTNAGNDYVYGGIGSAIEALGMMYEISNDIKYLNEMIFMTENILLARKPIFVPWANQTYNVWGAPDVSTEQGDIIGHICYCAKLILLNSLIWNQIIPNINNFTNINNYTYYERALLYVTVGYEVATEYIIPNWINKDQHYVFGFEPYYGLKFNGTAVPWNQQMMINNGFQRLSECYVLLNINNSLIIEYDSYVQSSIDWFFENVKKYQFNKTIDCCSWEYALGDHKVETVPHGNYDIWGLTRAYVSKRYNLTETNMLLLSNTFTYEMTYSIGQPILFKEAVYDTSSNPSVLTWMYGSWIFLSIFDKSIYYNIANANMKTGGRQYNSPIITVDILWMKDYYYKKSGATLTPTVSPTLEPTYVPSNTPSTTPTISPTISPTVSSTIGPTITPTITPTSAPSNTPTLMFPTIAPTLMPTNAPTIVPTYSPIFIPTFKPTIHPTVVPISKLTTVPTVQTVPIVTVSNSMTLAGYVTTYSKAYFRLMDTIVTLTANQEAALTQLIALIQNVSSSQIVITTATQTTVGLKVESITTILLIGYFANFDVTTITTYIATNQNNSISDPTIFNAIITQVLNIYHDPSFNSVTGATVTQLVATIVEPSSSDKKKSKKLPGGDIAAAVILSIFGALLIIGGILYYFRLFGRTNVAKNSVKFEPIKTLELIPVRDVELVDAGIIAV